jgi:pectate disaccharide-lyase
MRISLVGMLLGLAVSFCVASPKTYYVASSGSDSNTGTMSMPFFTVNQALTVATAGDTIYLRGGTYAYTATQKLSISGTATDSIHIFAYPGEKPILTWESWQPTTESVRGAARGFYLTGNYYYIKGLDIEHAPDNGLKLEGSYNRVEQCIFHHNGDSGVQVGLKSNATNDGSLVCYNLIINCDSYLNADPATDYENADGFACKLYPGIGNKFYGCRSWENCDDGWDLYEAQYLIELDSCWTWHNGDPTVWGFTSFNGDGNGFKLGGNGVAGGHLVKNCIAFNNKETYSRGFHQNNNTAGITLYNCTAWGNTVNFGLNDNTTTTAHVLKNNIGCNYYANPNQSGASNAKLIAGSIDTCNSWDASFGGAITTNDFITISEDSAMAPREADGSLPNNGFARLKSTSKAIDRGLNVGLPFSGTLPDLGAFEYSASVTSVNTTAENIPHQVVLVQNYPNPFNPSTEIRFQLPSQGLVTLKIYNILGKEIATLVNETKAAGSYNAVWNAAQCASGVYFYQLTINHQSVTKKMLLLK